jgi:hypothetical protein
MFTTGSKLFLGATAVSIVAAIVFAVLQTGDTGWTATVGLITLSVVLAALTALNFYVRDSNVSAAHADAVTEAPAARPPAAPSMWPAITALAAALLVVGLVTEPVVFKAGLVLALAVVVEWMVQGWSERASADARYNAALRGRILHPLEFPILAAAGLAVVIFSFSRIMLFLSKTSGPVAFAVIAALVLFAGFLFASKQTLRRSVTIGICAVAALGLVSTGAVMAIDGPRELHAHHTIADDSHVCESNEESEVDEKASQNVAAKNSVAGTITWDGQRLVAEVPAFQGPQTRITVPRSTPTFFLFENESDDHARLTAHMGTFTEDVNGTPVKQAHVTCTQLVEEGGRAMLALTFSKSSTATPEDPYRLTVPGTGSEIEVWVP